MLLLALTAPGAAQSVPPPAPLSLAPGFAEVAALDCRAATLPDARLCASDTLRALAQRVIASTNARGHALQDGLRRQYLREAHAALWARLQSCPDEACLSALLNARLAELG